MYSNKPPLSPTAIARAISSYEYSAPQFGFTLLESVVALSLGILVIGVTVATYQHDKRQAQDVIAQLKITKAGVLRYNHDLPASTGSLRDLIEHPNETELKWNGPYVDNSIRMDGNHFDISKTFPDTRLELITEVIGGIRYQAVLVKGHADSQLRNAILAQCGEDCKPLPGREDLGLLIQQTATGITYTPATDFAPTIVPGTPTPPRCLPHLG